MNYKNIAIIIPAYKPDEKLLSTIDGIKEKGFSDIIIVNDGSGDDFEPVFEKVRGLEGVTLLVHPQNKGKGAALKTANCYIMENRPDCVGVVTADADGQHLPCDIASVAEAMADSGEVIIGARDFSDPNVPPRSKFGNRTTSVVFRLFFGMKLRDTQTGLRAIPSKYLPALSDVAGDRYEYETNVLFRINRDKIPYREVGISTVYIEENSSSHFRAVRDSIRIYSLILKYLFSAVASFAVDYIAFVIFKQFKLFRFEPFKFLVFNIKDTFPALFAARAISSIFNYTVNSKVVFGKKPKIKTLLKYYALVVAQITVSSCIVIFFEDLLKIENLLLLCIVKFITESILFLFTFRFQDKWVFND